jgi:hypothetical protein
MGNIDVPMSQTNIVVHSFELTKNHKVPMVVLKAIDEDYRVWWTMDPRKLTKPEAAKATNNTQHEDEKSRSNEKATTSKRSQIRAPRNRSAKKRNEPDAVNNTRHEVIGEDGEIRWPERKRRLPGKLRSMGLEAEEPVEAVTDVRI